jgi:hypothetical protein
LNYYGNYYHPANEIFVGWFFIAKAENAPETSKKHGAGDVRRGGDGWEDVR